MKKLLVLCLVAFVSVTASAQLYVGGTLGASYDKVKVEGSSESTTSFVLAPEIGYAFDKTIAVGLTGSFGYGDNEDFDMTQYEIAPYIRATFAEAKNVKFFAEGVLFLNHSKYSASDDDDIDFSYNTYGAAIRPGFLVNVGKNVQLVGKATMFQYSKAEKHDIDVKSWRVALPNSFTLGVLVNI